MRSINEAYTDVNDFKTMMSRIEDGVQQQLQAVRREMVPQEYSGNRAERREHERLQRRSAKRTAKV